MSDIELVIKIPQDAYELMRKRNDLTIAERVIANGKPLKKGLWIPHWNVVHQKEYYYCSECGEEFSYDGETGIKMIDYNFCPNCGADMRGDRNAGIN